MKPRAAWGRTVNCEPPGYRIGNFGELELDLEVELELVERNHDAQLAHVFIISATVDGTIDELTYSCNHIIDRRLNYAGPSFPT
jgi:hypothetical protein